MKKVTASVHKVWDDDDNRDGLRPTATGIKVNLLRDGEVYRQGIELNTSNNWTATISGLPKYNNGVLINYTWTEENMPQGYSQTDYTTLGTTTTIENTYDITLESLYGYKTPFFIYPLLVVPFCFTFANEFITPSAI